MGMRAAALADDFARVALYAQCSSILAIRSLHLGRLPLSRQMAVFVDRLERGHRVTFEALPPLKAGRAMPEGGSRNDANTRTRAAWSDFD